MGRSVFDGVSDGSWAVFAEKAVAARDAAIEAAVKARAEMQAELDLARSLHDVAVRQRGAANYLLEEVTRERDEARAEIANLRGEVIAAQAEEKAAVEAADKLTRERDEARTEILALKECLRWYVENDDTIAGGKWDEDNATWLEGKRRAMRLLGMRE